MRVSSRLVSSLGWLAGWLGAPAPLGTLSDIPGSYYDNITVRLVTGPLYHVPRPRRSPACRVYVFSVCYPGTSLWSAPILFVPQRM